MSFWKDKKTLVTGGHGFVGHAVLEELNKLGCTQLISPTKQECDLTIESNVKDLFSITKPEIVIHLAGKVGGILANKTAPADFFYKNLTKIFTNIFYRVIINNPLSCFFAKAFSFLLVYRVYFMYALRYRIWRC